MYQNEQHYVLNSATAFPMMNKEMISKSDLRKLTGNSFDPIIALKVMKVWIQRVYSYQMVALTDQVNTWVDAACLRILFKPGEFHEWATEVVPDLIFAPPHPTNGEHIWERIEEERQAEMEQESFQGIENEAGLTYLADANGGEYSEVEEDPTEDHQDHNASITADAHQATSQVVIAELIPEEQVSVINAQVEASTNPIKFARNFTERNGIEDALNQSRESGEPVVLPGMYGVGKHWQYHGHIAHGQFRFPIL